MLATSLALYLVLANHVLDLCQVRDYDVQLTLNHESLLLVAAAADMLRQV